MHAALAAHTHLFLSQVKEPKYYMCGDSPPPAYKGPGDAHSIQEWIWQREAAPDQLPGPEPGAGTTTWGWSVGSGVWRSSMALVY